MKKRYRGVLAGAIVAIVATGFMAAPAALAGGGQGIVITQAWLTGGSLVLGTATIPDAATLNVDPNSPDYNIGDNGPVTATWPQVYAAIQTTDQQMGGPLSVTGEMSGNGENTPITGIAPSLLATWQSQAQAPGGPGLSSITQFEGMIAQADQIAATKYGWIGTVAPPPPAPKATTGNIPTQTISQSTQSTQQDQGVAPSTQPIHVGNSAIKTTMTAPAPAKVTPPPAAVVEHNDKAAKLNDVPVVTSHPNVDPGKLDLRPRSERPAAPPEGVLAWLAGWPIWGKILGGLVGLFLVALAIGRTSGAIGRALEARRYAH